MHAAEIKVLMMPVLFFLTLRRVPPRLKVRLTTYLPRVAFILILSNVFMKLQCHRYFGFLGGRLISDKPSLVLRDDISFDIH